MKQTIKLSESKLERIIAETIRSVVNENSFHRGYKAGRNLDVLYTTDGSYRDEDIFSCLAELKSKLKQAEARAKMPQYGNEGEARNYLVAAIDANKLIVCNTLFFQPGCVYVVQEK